MGVWYDFIFDNAYQLDAASVEASVRSKYPLLLHKDEQLVLAFKDRGGKGRDKEYFTSHRILIKDGKGIGSKRKNYQSITYKSIQAFSVETAGKFDGDVSIKVWSTGVRYARIDFATANVDIYQLQQFLSAQVAIARSKELALAERWSLTTGHINSHIVQDTIDPTPPNMDQKQTTAGNIIDWFGDNAKQVDAKEVEKTFKTSMPILLQDETVEIAFKSGRDFTVFTNRRVIQIDVQGIYGKKIEFQSILWKSVHAYAVQTAGAFLDRDMEMTLYTNILGLDNITQDFRHGKADLFAIQKVLCNHILGPPPPSLAGTPDAPPTLQGEVDDKGFWWFRDNQRPLDTVEINRTYHSDPHILRSDEVVEMAFKGRRDVTLFTNLRVLLIDPKGLVGRQIEYTSIPWESIVGHAVRTAGAFLDFDTEVCIWTEKEFDPGRGGTGDDDPPVPPLPVVSYFELDFNKNRVDMHALNYYLSRRLLLIHKMKPGQEIPLDAMTQQFDRPDGLERLVQWLGGNQRELDPAEIDRELHTSTKILLDDEKVLMAFKAGRDSTLFTNLRVVIIDVQGLIGTKVEYHSIPYKSIRAWSVETAGVWDQDTELNLYTRNRWSMAKIEMDFRTGKADIAQINRFFSSLIIGLPTDAKMDFGKKNYSSGNREANPINKGSFGLLNNSTEIDAAEIEMKLRSDPALLLNEENVLRAFQSGRDIDVYTDRRMIIIDTKGITGKRVKYKSIPLKYIHGFEFETAGHMDRDAEIYCYTDIADIQSEQYPRIVPCLRTKQSLLVKHTDIYEIGKLFTDLLIFNDEKQQPMEEPEIDLGEYWK